MSKYRYMSYHISMCGVCVYVCACVRVCVYICGSTKTTIEVNNYETHPYKSDLSSSHWSKSAFSVTGFLCVL